MNELIRITEKDGKQAVSARELHVFLEVKSNFTTWTARMFEYGFEEDKDFIPILEKSTGGRPSVDYALTLDTAKHWCMMQRSEKGMQARQYFIEAEKRFREILFGQFQIPQSYSEALLLAANQAKHIEDQQKQIKSQTKYIKTQEEMLEARSKHIRDLMPAATFANAVRTSDKSCLIAELAKILRQNGVEVGQNRLFEWMRNNGFLCKSGEYYNQPTQKAMEMGLFEIKKTTIVKPDGTTLVNTTPKITGKGQIFFVNRFLYNKARGDKK